MSELSFNRVGKWLLRFNRDGKKFIVMYGTPSIEDIIYARWISCDGIIIKCQALNGHDWIGKVAFYSFEEKKALNDLTVPVESLTFKVPELAELTYKVFRGPSLTPDNYQVLTGDVCVQPSGTSFPKNSKTGVELLTEKLRSQFRHCDPMPKPESPKKVHTCEFKKYEGFTESYNYCVHCDKKERL
jgi:hypothetical protein